MVRVNGESKDMAKEDLVYGPTGEVWTWMDGEPMTEGDLDRLGVGRKDHGGWAILRYTRNPDNTVEDMDMTIPRMFKD